MQYFPYISFRNDLKSFLFKHLLVLVLFVFPAGITAQGNALDFDGGDDYVDMGSSIIGSSTVFTIEFWINARDLTTGLFGQNAIFGEFNSGTSDTRNHILVGADGTIFFDQFPPGGGGLSSSSGVITTGTWHHVAYVQDGINRTFYIDGVLDVTDSGIETYSGALPDRFWLGRRPNGADFNGQLDEFRIWSIARDSADIVAAMNCSCAETGALDTTGLEVCYTFDNVVDPVEDVTGNGYNGTRLPSTSTGPQYVIPSTVPITVCIPPIIPTMSQWGMFLFGLIVFTMALVAGYSLKRRKAIN